MTLKNDEENRMNFLKNGLMLSMLSGTLLVTGCNGGSNDGQSKTNQPAGMQINSKIIPTSNQSDKTEAISKVIQNQQDFDDIYLSFNMVASFSPRVDFSKKRVVVYSLGLQSNKQNRLSFLGVYDDGKEIKAVFKKTKLAQNCTIESGKTVPNFFVEVDTTKPIKIVTQEEIKNCITSKQIDSNSEFTSYDKNLKPNSEVLTTNKGFEEKFGTYNPSVSNIPQVDFSKQRVVFYTLGYQSDNANSLSFVNAYDEGDKVKVVVNKHTLLESCPAGTKDNIPNMFVVVNTTKPIEVVSKDVSERCDGKKTKYSILKQSDGHKLYNKLKVMTAYNKVLSNIDEYSSEMTKFDYVNTNQPQVDFSKSQVIMSTLGARYFGAIPSVEFVGEIGGVTKVHLRWTLPDENKCYAHISNPHKTVPHIFLKVDSRKPVTLTSDSKVAPECPDL